MKLNAEFRAESVRIETIAEEPRLECFFPPAPPGVGGTGQFRHHTVTGQTQSRLETTRKMLTILKDDDQGRMLVLDRNIGSWISVLAALRIQWYVELIDSSEQLTKPTREDMADDPKAAATLDWFALLIESTPRVR